VASAAPSAGPIVSPNPIAALTRASPAARSVVVVRSAMYACEAGPVPEPISANTQRDTMRSG
jgi:hypothetical protein